jgi:hypothetical protein
MTKARNIANTTLVLGSTTLTLGTTATTTIAGLTLTTPTINGATLSGTLSGAHTISGVATFSASPVISSITNTGTITLPTTTGTLALNNQSFYIGTQAIAINAGSGTITALPGVTSINGATLPSSGTIPNTGQTFYIGTQAITIAQGSGTITSLPGVSSLNGITHTANTTGFSLAGGSTTSKTLQVNNTITLAGTDASTLNIGGGGTLGSAAYTASTAYAPAAGSSSITTLGTVTAGSFPAANLSGTTLASGVTGSSLTSVGTITSGTWSGSFGAVSGANLTSLTAANIAAGTLASTVLPAAGTVTTAGQLGYIGLPQTTNPGAYTLTAADNGKQIYYTTTGQTLTIPANGTLALPIGFSCVIINAAGVTTSIAITTDTLYLAGTGTTGTRTLAPYGMATLVKIAGTTWTITGNGLT